MTTAGVTGTPEGHGYVCGTVASSPLLRGTVETDNVIHKLYPTLNITKTQKTCKSLTMLPEKSVNTIDYYTYIPGDRTIFNID